MPEQLNDFLDHTKDIQGYLSALTINFNGLDEKFDPFINFMSRIGREEVDPVDYYDMLTELHSVLGVLVTGYPETEGEVLPCIKVIDELRKMFQMKL